MLKPLLLGMSHCWPYSSSKGTLASCMPLDFTPLAAAFDAFPITVPIASANLRFALMDLEGREGGGVTGAGERGLTARRQEKLKATSSNHDVILTWGFLSILLSSDKLVCTLFRPSHLQQGRTRHRRVATTTSPRCYRT